MSASIREIDLERDAPGAVEIARESNPTAVTNVAAWLQRIRSVPERAGLRIWVAEADGRLVGRVECLRNFFASGSRSALVAIAVRETHRRHGIGTALYERALAHAETIGAQSLLGTFHETAAGTAFAEGLGFELVRAETMSVLEPAAMQLASPPDVTLRTVRDVDPQLVHAVNVEAALDSPQTEQADHIPYDEWERFVLRQPVFRADGSFCAIVDGVAAAVSLLCVDEETGRGLNMFTGTLRAYRGRGLALAVKVATTRWAAEHGVRQIVTTNDETNAPMLAINRRLGYRPAGRHVEYRKLL